MPLSKAMDLSDITRAMAGIVGNQTLDCSCRIVVSHHDLQCAGALHGEPFESLKPHSGQSVKLCDDN